MTPLPRLGARLLAVALALTLLPAYVHAEDTALPPHPWKQALARRMAEERFEHREAREQREQGLRRLARERARWAKSGTKARKRGGEHVRPARPDDMIVRSTEAATPSRRQQPFGTRAFTPPPNKLVNNRTGDSGDSGQSETAIAAVGDRLIAAWNDGQGFQTFGDTQGWATSSDGGQTWTDRGDLPHPTGVTGFQWTSDPVLTVNEKTGAVYYAGLCDFNDVNGARSGVAIVKGRWNGATFTWGAPAIVRGVSAASDFLDKEWIVADSVTNRVHITYTRFPGGLSRIEYQSADSGLTTFTTPQLLSLNISTENGWVQAARPVVDGTGRVYVMYYLIGQQEQDFYRLARSNDGGLTFGTPITVQSVYTNFGTGTPGFNRNTGIQFASITADRSQGPNRGRLYLTWAESVNWLDDVLTIGQNGNRSETEANETPGTANAATVGQTIRGAIGTISDVDVYTLPLLAGQHLIAAADSMAAGGELSLRLLAGDQTTRLAFTSFDSGVNPTTPGGTPTPAGWVFTAPATGTYYLRIASRVGTGAYRIRTGLADRNAERGRDQRDVFLSWSDDGATWSTPTSLSDDAVGFDSFVPEVAVAPDGGVYCAWFDYRDSPPGTNGGQASVYLARSGDGGGTWTTLGAVTDTLSNWSATPSNLEPNQGDYLALIAGASTVWPCWSDGRRGNPDVFTAAVPLIPNGAQVVFNSVRLGNRRITIDWNTQPIDTLTMRLYRSTDGGAFAYREVVQFGPGGSLTYIDTTVVGDRAYSYRLGRFVNNVELFYAQVSVFLPSTFPLAMSSPWPNPVNSNSFTANFSLATGEPAELILFDITGREVYRRSIVAGQGPQSLTIPVGPELKQGMYVLTLRQGGHNASTRVHLLR